MLALGTPAGAEQSRMVADEKDPKTGMEFTVVKGGCFSMGAFAFDQNALEDEKPAHEVCVGSFRIGTFEVTQDQWQAVMGDNPSGFKNGRRPVENITWSDAQDFLARLNKATGRQYRLPTEAEWEFAARGGVKSKGFLFAGSNAFDDVAWVLSNSERQSATVGGKRPNELGIYDMSGNVWEMCADRYAADYFKESPKENPAGPAAGPARVMRGGSWARGPEAARVTQRVGIPPAAAPGSRNTSIGFRVAISQ
jgi:formylglycine-generating enzyme required for sulfatase activity